MKLITVKFQLFEEHFLDIHGICGCYDLQWGIFTLLVKYLHCRCLICFGHLITHFIILFSFSQVLFGGDSCDAFSNVYLTSFAIFSYIVFFIASVQLVCCCLLSKFFTVFISYFSLYQILCMVTDSYDDRTNEDKWKKAFRITIQKCILGTVIAATGTRAIYFTIQVN